MPKRDELPTLERAVSDTLDEYLARLYGIMVSSWAYPDEFIEFLSSRGFCITEESRIQELEADNASLRAEVKKKTEWWQEYVGYCGDLEEEMDTIKAELVKLER